jgi:hypothetical protein
LDAKQLVTWLQSHLNASFFIAQQLVAEEDIVKAELLRLLRIRDRFELLFDA